MNFIAATVEFKSPINDPINAYGLDYRGADAVVPAGNSGSEVKLRLLCYDRAGAKLTTFEGWKPGTRALVTGNIVFSDDTSKPLDLIITTIETNIPQDMYCNQVVLGNAFFGSDEIRERKNNQIAVKIGTTLDNSNVTTWLFLETLMNHVRKNLLSVAVKDELFVSKVISVNTAKMMLIVLIVQSLQLTLALELNKHASQLTLNPVVQPLVIPK